MSSLYIIHDVLTSEDIFLHVFRAKLSFRALFPITLYRESLSRGDNFPSPSLCCSREISIPELGLLSSFYITSSFSWIQTSCWLPHKHRINTASFNRVSTTEEKDIERNVPHLTYFGGEGKFSLRWSQQQLYFSLTAMEIGQGKCSFPLERSNKTTSTTRLLNTAEIYYLVLGCAGFA
jgi:hypothetical protein